MDYSNGDWTSTWKNSESSHPSSSRVREEYSNHEQPGSAHFHPSHMSYASLTSEDPSFRPRGILTFDLQYPSNLEPSFIAPPYQGNHLVEYPSPTSQHVSAQATFCPMVSGAPSDASTPAASFCAPPPHHPGWSPAPFSYPPYDPRLEMSSVQPARLDVQPVSVSRVGPEGYVQPSYTIPALRQDRISDVSLNVYPPRPPRRTWPCPLCHERFFRPQDRNRHLPSHLPYWIGCSYGGCSWRGYRLDTFRKHWHSKHPSTSQVPDESGSKLYDPWPLVEGIVRDSVSIGDAENLAVTRIKKIALVLDRQELLMDPWGRKGKTLKGSRQYSRFTKRTNALSIALSTPSVPPAKLFPTT